MHPDTRDVASHMREFGLCVLGRAIYDSTFSEQMRPFAHALSVVHASHGAEIALKAMIAEEHPLLVFKSLPKQTQTSGTLTIAELLEYARSYDYFQLPDVLWSATGYRMPGLDRYLQFGRLRNKIVHFAVPAGDLAKETLRFCIEFMEPILEARWNESAIPYAEEWDDVIVTEGYLINMIEANGISMPDCVSKRLCIDD